jgi:uncharacterized repeat protein (TIGR01451 family)
VSPVEMATATASASAAMNWSRYGSLNTSDRFRKHGLNDDVGLFYLLQFSVSNGGDAAVSSGSTVVVTMPPGLVFVGVRDNPALTVEHSLTPWVSTGGVITATQIGALGRVPQNTTAQGSVLLIEVWLPCDDIPVTRTDATYHPSAVFDGVENTASGPLALHLDPRTNVPAPPSEATGGGARGAGATMRKNGFRGAGPDTQIEWNVFVTPNKGVLPYTDVLVQDVVPVGVTVTSASAVPGAEFTTHYCVLPNQDTL